MCIMTSTNVMIAMINKLHCYADQKIDVTLMEIS
jgi:hypothetical protein